MAMVLAGEPQVVTGLGSRGDPIGGDQRAVQAQVGLAGGVRLGEDMVQVRGVRGDGVQALVQIAIGGGVADGRVGGERMQVDAVAQPAQHQQHLSMHGGRALPRPRLGTAPDPGNPPGHRPQDGCGHVQAGTMRHGELPGKRSGVFGETTLTPGVRFLYPPPADQDRRPSPAVTPSKPVRKPLYSFVFPASSWSHLLSLHDVVRTRTCYDKCTEKTIPKIHLETVFLLDF